MRLSIILGTVALTAAGTAVQAQQSAGMQHPDHEMKMMSPALSARAIAVLSPAAGSKVQGVVTFQTTEAGVRVVADITGLTPGRHGFHIHEFGDCTSADFTSAGPHFMAPGQTHGSPMDSVSHAGDMGNLEADSTGHAHAEWTDSHIALAGPNSIVGRGVIIHEKEDDLKTQPTGNSGARIACGTIGIAKP